MKRTEIPEAIERAIADRPNSMRGKWYITWQKGALCCVPYGGYPAPEKIFAVITREQARDGLRANEWTKLIGKIAFYLEEIGICPKHQKP